jgi:hypothetical protein
MRKWILIFLALASALLLSPGCNGAQVPADAKPEVSPAAAPKAAEAPSLADLLTRPRSELAELVDEWLTRIRLQEKSLRERKTRFVLLTDFGLPLSVPVWRSASFSAKAGFSLPPYLPEGRKDTELALHLARHGDGEAASKLIDAADPAARRQLEALRTQRNYPAEWTRLVGLMLHVAQLRLATADPDGARDLLNLHRQLQALLDPKAARGPLGAALLPRGRSALALAAVAWRADNKTKLAELAEAGLKAWGDVPEPKAPALPGADRAAVARLMGIADPGEQARALFAPEPSVARAFDLLALPLPEEGADCAIACFDASGRLTEVLVTYRQSIREAFPEPRHLARLLEDWTEPAPDGSKTGELRRRTYRAGAWTWDVAVVPSGTLAGAFVRLAAKQEPQGELSRDFGAVHLDRTFEQNRLHLVPELRGNPLTVTQPRVLGRILNPVPPLRPVRATLEKEAEHDLLARLTLGYARDNSGAIHLHHLVLPLATTLGPARITEVNNPDSGHLALTWEDARTRYTLQVPFDQAQAAEFEARDLEADRGQRQARATASDRAARLARLEARKPQTRLSRQQEQVELGMTRAQVLQVLPTGKATLKRNLAVGLSVTFTAEPPPTAVQVVRQMDIRFDQSDRVAELRVYYTSGPAARASAAWTGELLRSLKKRGGAPVEGPPSWAGIWADLPPHKPAPRVYRWQDDTTLLTYEHDGGSAELVLRDCPPAHESGTPLPPLEYLPRGPAGLPLGLTKEEVVQQWQLTKPVTTADGAFVLNPGKPSPFDGLLVWFEHDRVVRVVGRHAPAGTASPTVKQMSRAVEQTWAREVQPLGWPRRFDFTPHRVLEGVGWHDDRTRLRVFWQETGDGTPRLFREWKDMGSLPQPATALRP